MTRKPETEPNSKAVECILYRDDAVNWDAEDVERSCVSPSYASEDSNLNANDLAVWPSGQFNGMNGMQIGSPSATPRKFESFQARETAASC